MIVTRTPLRISLFGGGSDLDAYVVHAPGAILSATIDKYIYIASHPSFDGETIHLKYSRMETVRASHEVVHPIVREALRRLEIQGGLEIVSMADVPTGAGLGSSSAFTVGLLHNLGVRLGVDVGPEWLAREACRIEIEQLGDPIGRQDQYAAAFGGLNWMEFPRPGEVRVERLQMADSILETLRSRLLLFFTGTQRAAADILRQQEAGMRTASGCATVDRMVALVRPGVEALRRCDVDLLGELLHESWNLKRSLARAVSTPEIDSLYARALANGATGGKLLGAGGGGFLLLVCREGAGPSLREALHPLRALKFGFESGGSKVIHEAAET